MAYEKDIKERTKKFAIRIIRLCAELRKNKIDFPLVNQLLRSGTSVGANVVEAKASSTRKELIRFYEISLRSANESGYWIDIISEGFDLKLERITDDKKELLEISKVLATIIINLKK
ncbi:MAG: four helix bundle protein [Bacteroidetes bacterium]|nr:four helix bundle protein [Bacteroidota bacterium]